MRLCASMRVPFAQDQNDLKTDLSFFLGYADTAFLATFSGYEISSIPDPIIFDEIRINPGGHYESTNGIYTVPTDGIYKINIQIKSEEDEYNNCGRLTNKFYRT